MIKEAKRNENLLVEIQTEELPPRSLRKLGEAFCELLANGLEKSNLTFSAATFFATPRRLAVLIKDLDNRQPDQWIERKGPALRAAFDANGEPSEACKGFARSLGVSPAQLITLKNDQGEWVGFRQLVAGKTVKELMGTLLSQAILALPIAKRMRWGEGDALFVRPVHGIILLYGKEVIETTLLGIPSDRLTVGHRFLAPLKISIAEAALYASALEEEGHVLADFNVRREKVREAAMQCIKKHFQEKAQVYISSEALLNEVTGLVEWPIALCGQFDPAFLNLPEEVLISSMQDHQRYFPVMDNESHLLPYFVTISNIESHDPKRVIQGNERVLRARLADAAFFYATDQKESLAARVIRLQGIIFQAKLGTLYDKAVRLSELAGKIAEYIGVSIEHAKRAGMLAKTDLTTHMVGEFPELQGVMGGYYALHDKENVEVSHAIKEHYMPRFAGDSLPKETLGQILGIADRMDTLVGTFGIHQIPTGDKDPFGLRRAALGILRILIEKEINLDLKEVVEWSLSLYGQLENQETVSQVLYFIHERLRAWYQEKGVSPDVFAAVAALGITNPLDLHKRMKAVETFKRLSQANALSIANKRVSNILAKYNETLDAETIDPVLFEDQTENELATRLAVKSKRVKELSRSHQYEAVLLELAELREPVDDFFDRVMVMTEDKSRRENRLLLLMKLRQLFLNVADIALLQ